MEVAAKALQTFVPVKRRLELRGKVRDIAVYDDFAHHPTAIMKTIDALKKSKRHARILVVLEFGSYTMKTGVHQHAFGSALEQAHKVYCLKPKDFALEAIAADWTVPYRILDTTQGIVAALSEEAKPGDGIIVMSNKGFEGIHDIIINTLSL